MGVAQEKAELVATRSKLLEGVAKTPDKLFSYCAQLLQDIVQLQDKVKTLPQSHERKVIAKVLANARRMTNNYSIASKNFNDLTPNTRQSTSIMKLKSIQPPSFSGDYKTWKFFWDNFEVAVHSNEQYSDPECYLILSKLLKEQPLELLEGHSMVQG